MNITKVLTMAMMNRIVTHFQLVSVSGALITIVAVLLLAPATSVSAQDTMDIDVVEGGLKALDKGCPQRMSRDDCRYFRSYLIWLLGEFGVAGVSTDRIVDALTTISQTDASPQIRETVLDAIETIRRDYGTSISCQRLSVYFNHEP